VADHALGRIYPVHWIEIEYGASLSTWLMRFA